MHAAGISESHASKRGRRTVRVQGVRVADDLVKRQFRPDAPDVLWLADFSHLRTTLRVSNTKGHRTETRIGRWLPD
jgi:hypothetical protein